MKCAPSDSRGGDILDWQNISSEPRSMYILIGADQKEYGPVAAEEVGAWIAEGRANGQTLARFEGGPWKPLSTFPEFVDSLRSAPQPAPSAPSAPMAPIF